MPQLPSGRLVPMTIAPALEKAKEGHAIFRAVFKVTRINLTDAQVNRPADVALQMGALEAITAIAKRLVDLGFVESAKNTQLFSR